MKPYFQQSGITIYHGDCREILPALPRLPGMDLLHQVDSCITDPVWPNASVPLAGFEDPHKLLFEALQLIKARRLVIHLGCDTDPRFLTAVPKHWPFLRLCWLRYARPSYKGRLLNGSEVAYIFGELPPINEHMLMSGESTNTEATMNGGWRVSNRTEGEVCNTDNRKRTEGHPCPRRIQHLEWLMKWYGGGLHDRSFLRQRNNSCSCSGRRNYSHWYRSRRTLLRTRSLASPIRNPYGGSMNSHDHTTLITREGKFHLRNQRTRDPQVFLRKWTRRVILATAAVGLVVAWGMRP